MLHLEPHAAAGRLHASSAIITSAFWADSCKACKPCPATLTGSPPPCQMCMGICIDVPDMLLAAGVGGFHAGPLTTAGPKAQSGNPIIVQVYQGADDPGITQESRTAFTVHPPFQAPYSLPIFSDALL